MNIVVTGASRGVGYQAALNFSRNRDHVVFALSRNEAGLKKLLEESQSATLVPIRCDLADLQSIHAAVKEIEGRVKSIEVLVNNAGSLLLKDFSDLTMEDWKEVFAVNVFGVAELTRQLLPLLKRGNLAEKEGVHAHVVNIASMGGIQGSLKFKGLSAYSSSKGALITMTECMSEELKAEGIRVNCVALGSVETEMFKQAFPGYEASSKAEEIGAWLEDFGVHGFSFFNGKTIQLSTSTP
jgi:NAD(P)-dependent dehydrogenase (short-subunit alcohol dehydrogenase family)